MFEEKCQKLAQSDKTEKGKINTQSYLFDITKPGIN